MSKIDDLIKQYCSNGVEYKELGEVCEIKGRIGFRGYTRNDQVQKGEGAISLSPANIVKEQINYDDCTYITWEKYYESPEIMVENNDIIFCKTASVGKTTLIKELPNKATINPQLVLLKKIKCNASYLSYLLKEQTFQNKVKKIMGLGSIPTISQKDFSKLTIPVPLLPVQEEIVKVLDAFTALEAELEARKRQYEYYRNKLLTFDENTTGKGVDWKMLSEVFVI